MGLNRVSVRQRRRRHFRKSTEARTPGVQTYINVTSRKRLESGSNKQRFTPLSVNRATHPPGTTPNGHRNPTTADALDDRVQTRLSIRHLDLRAVRCRLWGRGGAPSFNQPSGDPRFIADRTQSGAHLAVRRLASFSRGPGTLSSNRKHSRSLPPDTRAGHTSELSLSKLLPLFGGDQGRQLKAGPTQCPRRFVRPGISRHRPCGWSGRKWLTRKPADLRPAHYPAMSSTATSSPPSFPRRSGPLITGDAQTPPR